MLSRKISLSMYPFQLVTKDLERLIVNPLVYKILHFSTSKFNFDCTTIYHGFESSREQN